MRPNSYIFIEVPYQDYLYKKSISPHITFWNKESIRYLSKLLGLNCIFLDSCGLDHKRALFFNKNQNFFHKIINPFMFIDKFKDLTGILNIPIISDDNIFKLNVYGGNRICLRTIMKK